MYQTSYHEQLPYVPAERHDDVPFRLLTQDARSSAQVLQQQQARPIRRLDLTDWQHPPPRLQTELPLLECLTISSTCPLIGDEDAEPTIIILFGEPVLRIRAFALQPLRDWIPGNHFPNLTHLRLSSFRDPMMSHDAMRYLIGLLSNTPVLEYLYISGFSATAEGPRTQVTLPSLRAFTCVSSDLSDTLLLLEHVNLPEDVLVRLDDLYCRRDQPGDEDYLPRPLLSYRFLASFTSLELVADDAILHLVAEGPRSGLWISARYESGNPALDPWIPWIAALHRMLPLASLRTLHVSVLQPDALPEYLLPYAPNLISLAVRIHPDFWAFSESACRELLNNIYWALGGGDEPGTHRWLCPALESLGVEIQGGKPDDFSLPPLSWDIARMVAKRASAGNPLRRLVLQPHRDQLKPPLSDADMHGLFAAALAPLRQYVGMVELLGNAEPVVCPLKMSERWKVDAFEKYWELPKAERPRYRFWSQGLRDE